MSLASIIQKIDAEAEAYGQKLIDNANAEAERIRAQGRRQAEAEAEQILAHTEEELRNFRNKQMATRQLRMRKEKLDNRQRILEDVFTKAVEQLLSSDPEQYRAMLRNILLSVDEERSGSIIASKADKAVITREFVNDVNAALEAQGRKLQFKLPKKTAAIERGLVIDFRDFEVNYSIEHVLRNLWEDLKRDVSARLFAESADEGNHGNS